MPHFRCGIGHEARLGAAIRDEVESEEPKTVQSEEMSYVTIGEGHHTVDRRGDG